MKTTVEGITSEVPGSDPELTQAFFETYGMNAPGGVVFEGVGGETKVVNVAEVGHPVGGIAPESLSKADVPPARVTLGGETFCVAGQFGGLVREEDLP